MVYYIITYSNILNKIANNIKLETVKKLLI